MKSGRDAVSCSMDKTGNNILKECGGKACLPDPPVFSLIFCGFYFHSAELDLMHGGPEGIIDLGKKKKKNVPAVEHFLNCIIPQQALDSSGAVDQVPTVCANHSASEIS